ncbi:MAG: hypothetical protein JO080_16525 [Mucilaginibacter sp.]|nr:hypothetical protein [Mucilaginibacter sp.]
MNKLTQLIKEYPVATGVFLVYMLMWVIVANQLYDMNQHPTSYSHGEMTYYLPFFGFLLALVYLIILIAMSVRFKKHQYFYSRLAVFAGIPILVVILMVMAEIR